MEEIFGFVAARLFVAAIVGGVITAVICFLLNAIVMPFTRTNGVKKARAEGREVTATLTKVIRPMAVDALDRNADYTGLYTYQYGGKTYHYRGRYVDHPPYQVTLYFRRDPSKATIMMKYGKLESEWKVIFLVCFCIVFLFSLIA